MFLWRYFHRPVWNPLLCKFHTDASHGLGIRTLDIKHPLLHVWTEDLEEVGQTEEARQAMHFHLAKLAAGMVHGLPHCSRLGPGGPLG